MPLARSGVIQGSFLHAQVAAPPRSGTAQALPAPRLTAAGVGQRLPQTIQRKMEALFGTRFDDVRIHVGPQAPALGAAAVTEGADIYFAPGRYAPETARGQQLLAHELAHVLQQRSGRARNPSGDGIAVLRDPALEAEADRMALRALHALAAPAMPPANPRGPSPRVPAAILSPKAVRPLARARPGAPWRPAAPAIIQRMEAVKDADMKDVSGVGSVEHPDLDLVPPSKNWTKLDDTKFNKVKALVDAAIKGGGGAAGLGADVLYHIMGTEEVKATLPKTSEGTYAIGLAGKEVLSTGPSNFEAAVESVLPSTYTLTKLGYRDAFVHGESTIYQAKTTVSAIVASQPCCLFCYGFLELNRIAHPPIRKKPFPKGWHHPDGSVKVTQNNYQVVKNGSFVWINYGTDQGFYRVE